MTLGLHSHPKAKTCAMCPREFLPRSSLHTCCSQRCATRKVNRDRAARQAKEREEFRARKAAIKTIPDLIKEAQCEFNAYIRARDADRPCICCGEPLHSGEVGGAFDCGHYRSTGSAPHLRFDERNAHAQRKQCNRYGAGRAVDYRVGLIARLGREAVEALESDNRVHKWTREELIAIRDDYRARVREMKKQREA